MPNNGPTRITTACVLASLACLLFSTIGEPSEPILPKLGSFLTHPLQVDPWLLKDLPDPGPAHCREHVYIFFVNGADPLNVSNIYGLAEFIKCRGYRHMFIGHMLQGRQFLKQIRHIRCHDPSARIVLLGYSGGTYVVRQMANSLRREGIHLDLLIYLGGDMIFNSRYSQPDNACRILNITGHGCVVTGGNLLFAGDQLDRAVNVRIPVRHILLPRDRRTIYLLFCEFARLASPARPHPVVTGSFSN